MKKVTWDVANNKVKEALARYNYTVSGDKFGDLYGREYNLKTDQWEFVLLTYPVRFGSVIYYVTEDFPAVYKFNENTGKYRESKTAYKALQACERAIDKAVFIRDSISYF